MMMMGDDGDEDDDDCEKPCDKPGHERSTGKVDCNLYAPNLMIRSSSL